MSRARISRWAGRTVLAGLCWLALAAIAVPIGAPSATVIALALPGAACTVFLGKAFALIPSYFARTLSPAWAPQSTALLVVPGVFGLAAEPFAGVPSLVGVFGATLWLGGVAVWAGSLVWTIRGNLTGRETGTGEANAEREPLDRLSNATAPLAMAYLLIGAVVLLAVRLDVGWPAGGRVSMAHLLGAGGAALAIFAVGFRLYPRFLVAEPPNWLARIVLPAGALGPALLAVGVGGRTWALHAGAALETTAIVGFAVAYVVTFSRSDKRRIGLYGPLAGSILAVGAAALAVSFVVGWTSGVIVPVHRRLMLLGFLGTTIAGTAFQFYPPNVGSLSLSSDRTAAVALAALSGGLAIHAVGVATTIALVDVGGAWLAAGGATLVPILVGATLFERGA